MLQSPLGLYTMKIQWNLLIFGDQPVLSFVERLSSSRGDFL